MAQQKRSAHSDKTITAAPTDLLPTMLRDLMDLAATKTEKDARGTYADAAAVADEIATRTGANVTVIKNNISTAASMFFMPGAAAAHGARVSAELDRLGL